MYLKGIAVSPGFAQGQVFLMKEEPLPSISQKMAENIDLELSKFYSAQERAARDLQQIVSTLKNQDRHEQAEIFEAHVLMVQDPEITTEVVELIRTQKIVASWAYKTVTDKAAEMLGALGDEYLSARATDVRDIAQRVMRILAGQSDFDLSKIPEGSIVVGHDLTPSQMAMVDTKKVSGFVTEIGGKTSHTAILARSLEIPAVAGVRGILTHLKDHDPIMIDALSGEVQIHPTVDQQNDFLTKKKKFDTKKVLLQEMKGLATATVDGRAITLGANIGTINDIPSLEANDAEAVGLYRTEFVFLDKKTLPSEDEQYKIYKEIFSSLKGKKCIIRTLDIGGDKTSEALPLPHEMNPFLGLRAVRLCLQEIPMFKDQIRAILRAAHQHDVGMMIPMISCIEEIIETKKIVSECKEELRKKNLPFSNEVEFGVMIEIPSAAMIVDLIARHVDFISIGTNDLTQYMCAVDRLNDRVEPLYNPYNPGFLRIMNTIISEANRNNIHAGICGSLAHSELLVPLLVGMGVHELSMTAQHVLETRKIIRNLNFENCKALVSEVLSLETSEAIKAKLKNFLAH